MGNNSTRNTSKQCINIKIGKIFVFGAYFIMQTVNAWKSHLFYIIYMPWLVLTLTQQDSVCPNTEIIPQNTLENFPLVTSGYLTLVSSTSVPELDEKCRQWKLHVLQFRAAANERNCTIPWRNDWIWNGLLEPYIFSRALHLRFTTLNILEATKQSYLEIE